MTLLKKIKKLISSSLDDQPTQPSPQDDRSAVGKPESSSSMDRHPASTHDTPAAQVNKPTHTPELPAYLSPITNTIAAWFDEQNWYYRRHNPSPDDEFRVHHLVASFAEGSFDWNCIFYINEKNQLISMISILLVDVPTSHYLTLLAKFNDANANINFGSIELDLRTGDIRTKLSLDAEFNHLNDRVLGTFMKGLIGLTQYAYALYLEAMSEQAIASLDELLRLNQSSNASDTDDQGFFVPSSKTQ